MTDGGNTWQPPDRGPTPPPPPPSGGGFGPPGGDDVTAPLPTATGPQPTAPVEDAPPGPSGSGRSRGKVIAAAVGALAIAGAGVFAITRIAGDASAGGASSPEAAANALLDALDDEDVLGAVDVLLPGERKTFRQPLQDLVSELERLEVLSDDELTGISGVDIQVRERDVDAEETNVEDVVNLTVTASVATSVDGDALPIGEWIRETVGDEEIAGLQEETPAEEGAFPVTAVRKGGRWYLSLFYSLAETIRAQTGADIPAEAIRLNGGDSPEAAIDNLLAAASDLDLAGMLGTLNPDEFDALQRYAPLFIDDAQRELDAVEVSVEISDTEYTVEGSGSKRSVTPIAATVSVSAEGEQLTGRLQDGCWVTEVDGEEVNSCEVSEQLTEELDLGDIFDDPQAVEDAIADVQETFADYENPGLIVREVDGAWYVSPLGTMSDQLLAVIRSLTREEIEHLIDVFNEVGPTIAGDIEEEMEGGLEVPTLDDFELPDDDATTVTVAPDDATQTDETTAADDETETDDTTADDPESLVTPCTEEPEAADAAACYDELLQAGEIDDVEIPWFLRHPECGADELMWTGEYFTLEDAEFVATVEDVAPCAQTLLAAGEVDALELAPELVHPECLTGQNPYLLSEEAFDELLDCAFG